MGDIRRKTKTNTRVNRRKTNKRNNTQKQRRTRKQTFRKNRRVNRGGNGTKRNREEEMHDAERDMIETEKDKENMNARMQNMGNKLYREPLGEGRGPVITVDQIEQLEISEKQQEFENMMDMEDDKNGPIEIGGKKKRAINK